MSGSSRARSSILEVLLLRVRSRVCGCRLEPRPPRAVFGGFASDRPGRTRATALRPPPAPASGTSAALSRETFCIHSSSIRLELRTSIRSPPQSSLSRSGPWRPPEPPLLVLEWLSVPSQGHQVLRASFGLAHPAIPLREGAVHEFSRRPGAAGGSPPAISALRARPPECQCRLHERKPSARHSTGEPSTSER